MRRTAVFSSTSSEAPKMILSCLANTSKFRIIPLGSADPGSWRKDVTSGLNQYWALPRIYVAAIMVFWVVVVPLKKKYNLN